jgi:hypothetical protein
VISVASTACIGGLAALLPTDAEACAIMWQPDTPAVPTIEVEQTLIVQNPATSTEHFIRRIAFRKANHRFGFVVPVPSKPEVAKIDSDPFVELRKQFPMVAPPEPEHHLFPSKGAPLEAVAAAPAGVQVISEQRVGSFTAFVLAADDADGLAKWLAANGFEAPAATKAWLEHYTKLHFYYTAFRFDPPAGAEAAADAGTGSIDTPVSAETIRISFSTPLPFYPYMEPDAPPAPPPATPEPPGSGRGARVLDAWVIAPKLYRPVAAVREGSVTHWKEPWFTGPPASKTVDEALRRTLGDEIEALLPHEGGLVVQAYEDQKKSRHGWGDIVFVPAAPENADPATLTARRAMHPLLDPATAVLP